MLKRKFEDKLNLWLNSNKVMLVDGARQVGKTYLIENFLRSHFKNYIYINLALNLDAISAFEHAKMLKIFCSLLVLLAINHWLIAKLPFLLMRFKWQKKSISLLLLKA